jgi:DNA-directed RNA polymerase subunit RPC12/RpoP
MIVRCGRCHAELEVSGPGEFVCPACGTRNAVRGGPEPYDLGSLGGIGAATPPVFGAGPAPQRTAPGEPAPVVTWTECPSCGYRFAMGSVEQVVCPNCETKLEVTEAGVRVAS